MLTEFSFHVRIFLSLFKWLATNSEGNSGGIISLWNSDLMSFFDFFQSSRWICVKATFRLNSFQCAIINLYAFNDINPRNYMRSELSSFISYIGYSVCVIRDFNEVLYPLECKNFSSVSPSIFQFQQFISNNSLLEFPLIDKSYTSPNSSSAKFFFS